MNRSIRILIVDNDVPTRVGLRTILASVPDMVVVGEAVDRSAAVAEATRLAPDVVLIDIQLLGSPGIAATREIASLPSDPPPRVLVLTMFDFDEYAFEAVRAGASGFVLKRAAPEQLIAAVRAVAEGNELPTPTATRELIERFTATSRTHRNLAFVHDLTT